MTVAFHVLVFPPCFANSEKVDDFSPIPPRFLPDGVKIRYQERHGGRSLRTLAITRSLLWWILGPALLHMIKVRTRTGIDKNDTPGGKSEKVAIFCHFQYNFMLGKSRRLLRNALYVISAWL